MLNYFIFLSIYPRSFCVKQKLSNQSTMENLDQATQEEIAGFGNRQKRGARPNVSKQKEMYSLVKLALAGGGSTDAEGFKKNVGALLDVDNRYMYIAAQILANPNTADKQVLSHEYGRSIEGIMGLADELKKVALSKASEARLKGALKGTDAVDLDGMAKMGDESLYKVVFE